MALKTPKKRLEDVLAKVQRLGLNLDLLVTRIANGESRQKLGAEYGIHPRWLSDLNPLVEQKMKAQEVEKVEAGEKDGDDIKASMAVMRRLSGEAMSPKQKVRVLKEIANDKETPPTARLAAIERLDALAGIIPPKTAMEPDPPPMFALPENTEIELRRYSDWLLSRGGDRGPQG